MKKIIIVLLLSTLYCFGCENQNDNKKDYSSYLFTNINWIRDNGNDIETIKFKSDGSFNYFCACGNPVNDADLCESYTYNEKTKEIKLDCFETTEETITTIKIIEMSDEVLKLDFKGEERIFHIEK